MNTNQLSTEIAPTIEISKIIDYRIKTVYGRDHLYIASEHATAIETLTGKKTIDWTDVHALESLGFTFNRVF